MALYDPESDRKDQPEIVAAIKTLIAMHRNQKMELVTSRQVKKELVDNMNFPEKAEKAHKALETITTLNLRELPRTPADIGKTIIGEMRLGQERKFNGFPENAADREIAEYLTANGVSFFVSLDKHFIRRTRRSQLKNRLASEGTQVLTPPELVRILPQ
jgi:hypothetical protein